MAIQETLKTTEARARVASIAKMLTACIIEFISIGPELIYSRIAHDSASKLSRGDGYKGRLS